MKKKKSEPVRTVKCFSEELNQIKLEKIQAFAKAYNKEKAIRLTYYQTGLNFSNTISSRILRDELRAQKYRNPDNLPSHGVELAIKDAFEMEEKYWASVASNIKVAGLKWSEQQKHYAN